MTAPLRLPPDDYIVMPGESECQASTAALHHYVAESKRWYFRTNWRRALEGAAGAEEGEDALPGGTAP